jgi:hypothetical protein
LLVLTAVSAGLYANTLDNSFFIWDDQNLIVQNGFIRDLSGIPFLFTPDYWQSHPYSGQYRALRTVSFALDYHFWGLNPFGYHLTNVLLHCLNVLLIYWLAFRVLSFAGPRIPARVPEKKDGNFNLYAAFACALLFAAHPVHVESVAWVKNRSDILC